MLMAAKEHKVHKELLLERGSVSRSTTTSIAGRCGSQTRAPLRSLRSFAAK